MISVKVRFNIMRKNLAWGRLSYVVGVCISTLNSGTYSQK